MKLLLCVTVCVHIQDSRVVICILRCGQTSLCCVLGEQLRTDSVIISPRQSRPAPGRHRTQPGERSKGTEEQSIRLQWNGAYIYRGTEHTLQRNRAYIYYKQSIHQQKNRVCIYKGIEHTSTEEQSIHQQKNRAYIHLQKNRAYIYR